MLGDRAIVPSFFYLRGYSIAGEVGHAGNARDGSGFAAAPGCAGEVSLTSRVVGCGSKS